MSKMKREYSYPVNAETITAERVKYRPEIDDDEKAGICERFNISDIKNFQAEVELRRQNDGCTIVAEGYVKAKIVQPCVITLEPVEEKLREEFTAYYLDERNVSSFSNAQRQKDESDPDEGGIPHEREMPDAHEEPEVIRNGKLDLGELIVQSLGLGVNPYPRSKKAETRDTDEPVYKDKEENAFSVLKDLTFKE